MSTCRYSQSFFLRTVSISKYVKGNSSLKRCKFQINISKWEKSGTFKISSFWFAEKCNETDLKNSQICIYDTGNNLTLSNVNASMSTWAAMRIVPPGVSYIPEKWKQKIKTEWTGFNLISMNHGKISKSEYPIIIFLK